MIINDEVNRVFITDKDKLVQESFHYLETVFNSKCVEITSIKQDTEEFVQ